ncbi:MAG: anaerobic ribonucleoside-triphosphate reductase [Castellaniella sp.]|uniref:anaerobic ribonucleoside-triphosphate reductase n=1 Tax=Castellaniella sp. TaxID=1955812 RepID=UPI003C77AFC2
MSNTHLTLNDAERQPCEIWTRVMGYHRPVSSFNIGKKGEFHERRFFVERPADPATGARTA